MRQRLLSLDALKTQEMGGGNNGNGGGNNGGSINGHDYVDLGLPSGLLWAACNIGAAAPEDHGDYFAWGETEAKDIYNFSTYKHGGPMSLKKYCNNSHCGFYGFTDDLTTLQPDDDVASTNWGGNWRMPTREEWDELLNNTNDIWTTQDGVKGRLFTASNGASLFLPVAGYREDGYLYHGDRNGFYQSSSLYVDQPSIAWQLYFDGGSGFMLNQAPRASGLSVRAVCPAIKN